MEEKHIENNEKIKRSWLKMFFLGNWRIYLFDLGLFLLLLRFWWSSNNKLGLQFTGQTGIYSTKFTKYRKQITNANSKHCYAMLLRHNKSFDCVYMKFFWQLHFSAMKLVFCKHFIAFSISYVFSKASIMVKEKNHRSVYTTLTIFDMSGNTVIACCSTHWYRCRNTR